MDMNNLANQAKQFLGSEQGQKLEQQYGGQFKQATGFDLSSVTGSSNQNQQSNNQNQQNQQGSNQNQQSQSGNSEGQFGQQGQYGAVTGQGFGGGMAKDAQGNSLQGNNQNNQQSNYEGFGRGDSTSSGGFGRNAAGGSFSRANQMGADSNPGGQGSNDDDNYNDGGYKTGTSTPGYRKDGDDDNSNSQFRGQNLGFTSRNNNDDEPEI